MTETKRNELMRPISVSVSPSMAAQLQSRAQQWTPENPNVSAYVRRLILQDLEGMLLDRNRALTVYRELERVQGFLSSLQYIDALPKGAATQAGECAQAVESIRDALWRVATAESKPTPVSSGAVSDAEEAAGHLAGVDLDQLARYVPSTAVAEPSARKRKPSATPAPRSKARPSSPKRAPK